MTAYNHPPENSTARVRHSADDALDDHPYQLLLEESYNLDDDYFALETRLILLLAGRLGMRVGEIVHMTAEWIDERRQMIVIPAHEPCTKGRDGGICGYCRQLAEQKVAHNDDMTDEDALRRCWEPKTQAAQRSIPYDFHPRAEITIRRYFNRFDRFQTSKSGVDRRLESVVEQVDAVSDDRVYPHCLRATAASYHASRGLDAISLQSLLGWSQLTTAHRYVRRSGERTKKALEATHAR